MSLRLLQKIKTYFRTLWDSEPGRLKKNWGYLAVGIICAPIVIGLIIFIAAFAMGMSGMVARDIWALLRGDGLKCPQEYLTAEERDAAFNTFSDDFYDKHPNASMRDFAKARLSFYKKRKCAEELKKYEDAAPGDIEGQIKIMLENAKQVMDAAEEDDFNLISFDGYMAQPEKYRSDATIGIVSRKSASDADGADGVVIAARENDPAYSAMDWLKSEYGGYDFSHGYEKGRVGGVDAYLLRWENPEYIDGALFLTPDGTQRITVSILGDSADPLLRDDLKKVLDAFSFK